MYIYVFTENGNIKQINKKFGNGSINSISEGLGYGISQIHSVIIFDKKDGIENIAFIPLTRKPIFLVSSQVLDTKYQINKLIESIDWSLEYDGPSVEFILEEAKELSEWSIDFIEKVIGSEVTDEDQIISTQYGYDFIITDGKLVDYQSSDNLNSWAKELMNLNKDMAIGYFSEGVDNHNGDKSKGREYLNLQAKFWSITPDSINNLFAKKYITSNGWIDFFRLMVLEYDYRINKDQMQLRAGENIIVISENNSFFECEFLGINYVFINGELDSFSKNQ